MTFKYILEQFVLEYYNYNQFNLVQRPQKDRVTRPRFSLRFSSIKNPSIFNTLGQLSAGFQKVDTWVHSSNWVQLHAIHYVIHIRSDQVA